MQSNRQLGSDWTLHVISLVQLRLVIQLPGLQTFSVANLEVLRIPEVLRREWNPSDGRCEFSMTVWGHIPKFLLDGLSEAIFNGLYI